MDQHRISCCFMLVFQQGCACGPPRLTLETDEENHRGNGNDYRLLFSFFLL